MPSPTRVRWMVLALLSLVSFMAYLLHFNMSVAGEPMMRELGLSELQLGMILGAFAWGYGLFQLPGGLFGDRLGGRSSVTLIVVAWGILNLLIGLVPGTTLLPVATLVGGLVVLRFLIGVTQAPIYPITSGVVIIEWFPVRVWGIVNGFITTAMTLGAAAVGPGIAWLAINLGWRMSFLVTAPLAFVTAALWWWIYRDDPAAHRGVNAQERDLIRTGRQTAPKAPRKGAWLEVLRHRDSLALAASYFCMNYVFYLFFNWFYYYLVEIRHLPAQAGGWFTGAQWMVGAAAASLGGWLCDRFSVRFGARAGVRLTAAGGLLLCAPLLVVGSLVSHPVLAVALLALAFGATQLTDGAYWVASMRIGGDQSAAVCGVMNTGGNIVGGFGSLMVPFLAGRFGWPAAISSGALFAIVGAGLWLLIRADRTLEAHD
ncbi:MAG TPA: MFS transporter [Patescibacteria group bacterium]|nr:MFS transporter [Patescibacteria group bacterium]